jgi:hypothetical protein
MYRSLYIGLECGGREWVEEDCFLIGFSNNTLVERSPTAPLFMFITSEDYSSSKVSKPLEGAAEDNSP